MKLFSDIDTMSDNEVERVVIEILKHAKPSDVIDALYKEASRTLPKIECEVCGYKGKTDELGQCPKCGAVMGKKEKVDDHNDEVDNYMYNHIDRADNVYEEDLRGRLEEF